MPSLQLTPGQRWTSDTEPELGLGTLLGTEGRTLKFLFPAVAELRNYAIGNMPMRRVRFEQGDRIESSEGWLLSVDSVLEQNGLLIYYGTRDDGTPAELPETHLNDRIQFKKPQERLFAGQIDENRWFELRYRTLLHINRLEQSTVRGLCGGRTDLLPHQLYIAHEVARRHAPRVLLADEVGLGKTIEACLILHHQLLTGRARRVLIMVPETLVHQWLVELLRRFNLRFSIFDEERCRAVEASEPDTNPFHSEQWILCSPNLFTSSPQRQHQASEGEWDLLIVDEAHHLEWSEEGSSPEYQVVERLAARTRGLLLLTATPEQLGRAGHFARLRLLDPNRFYDLKAFREEERHYEPVANAVEKLLSHQPLPEEETQHLLETLGEEKTASSLRQLYAPESTEPQREKARNRLIDNLLDRHGTGRVLFRNTRARVKGFPSRELLPHPLPSAKTGDPRLEWLIRTLRQYKQEKILLICALARTAKQLEKALRTREGIHAALFHEGMSIVERDRAAAWFADPEAGAQLLICSEIGSEGRNFQFSHHLVLYDLPLDPDLLEQRIGRLDRIGQKETIRIHLPYGEGSREALLLRWYHEGLNAFQQTCPAGHLIFSRMREKLAEILEKDAEASEIESLIEETRNAHRQAHQALQRGRDHLLELNSCREEAAEALRCAILAIDEDPALPQYMEQLFECYGLELEEHSNGSYILRPGHLMRCDRFPGLPREGMTFSYRRGIALGHEERQFLTWEHPMVRDAMEMVLGGEQGNATLCTAEHPAVKPGELLLEAIFLLECIAPAALRAGRFLPPTTIRLILNREDDDLSGTLPHDELSEQSLEVDPAAAAEIVRQHREEIKNRLDRAEEVAAERVPALIKRAQGATLTAYTEEIRRLAALKRVNPNVRDEEMEQLQNELRTLHGHMQTAPLRLEAVRLIVGL